MLISTRAELEGLGLTALRAMVDVEPYAPEERDGGPPDDGGDSSSSSSTSSSPHSEDPDGHRDRSRKKKKGKKKKKKGKRCDHHEREAKAVATSKITGNLPEFSGKALSVFAEWFARFLRLTGQTNASGRVKCDLLLQCCKNKYIEKQVKQVVTMSKTFADVLVRLERLYPTYETDLSIRSEIANLATLPANPEASQITELLGDFEHWVGRLTPGSYGSDELLFW